MQRVRQQVLASKPGELLTYANLVTEPAPFGAVAAALSRLRRECVVVRYAKGQYYRPQTTRFGPLQPSEGAAHRPPRRRGIRLRGRRGALQPTGPHHLGASDRESNAPRPRRTRVARVAFVVRPAPERASDVPLLQWLEVLRNLRRIPDARPDNVLARVQHFVKSLSSTARRRLAELASRIAPRPRRAGGRAGGRAGAAGRPKRGCPPTRHPQSTHYLPARPAYRSPAQRPAMEHPMTLHLGPEFG